MGKVSMVTPGRILIVQTSFLGDVILSTPLIEVLRAIHPNDEIWMMTTPAARELVAYDPRVRGVLTYDKNGSERGLGAIFRKAGEVASYGFRRAYLVQRHLRGALIAWGAKIPERWGFAGVVAARLYTERVPRCAGPHEVNRNLSLLDPLREKLPHPEQLRLFAPGDERLDARWPEWLRERRGVVVVAPGSAWKTKRWDPARVRDLCEHLAADGERVVIIGSDAERALACDVGRDIRGVEVAAGILPLGVTMRLVEGARGVVCNDSMVLHMASAFRVPTVAVFCSTVPEFGFGPWGTTRAVVVGRSELACRPCGRHGHRECPLATETCMRDVTADEVYGALRGVVEECVP